MRLMLTDVVQGADKVGLELPMGKTKVMSNGIGRFTNRRTTAVSGSKVEILPVWDATMYLGKNLSLTYLHDVELDNRIAKAWGAFNKHRVGLCNRGVSLNARLKLFDSVVSSTALYASGTWTMTRERERKLRTAQRKMLRQVLGIPWGPEADELDNVESFVTWITFATSKIKGFVETGALLDWVSEQRKRKWKWAGHCARRTDNRWTRRFLDFQLPTSRARGRPRARWSDDIVKFLQSEGMIGPEESWIDVAQSREFWNQDNQCKKFMKFNALV